MYAIVEIAGQQFKVEKDQQIFVHRLEVKEGSKVDFENVLLIDNGGKVNVGAPVIKGAKVTAKVLEHLKGDKVIVFKKKRRKGYKVKNGHRQYLTEIKIDSVVASGAKPAAKKEVAKKEEVKTETASADISKLTVADLKAKIRNDKVVLGLSGGVDSTVAAVLLHKAIGENLYCIFVDNGLLRGNEVEDVLTRHPLVQEAAVIGEPDDKTDEKVCAFITVNDFAETDDIKVHCSTLLTAYKVPKKIVIVDELPKSTVGKILRRELRK